MSRYRISYVGEDGRDHERTVWAKDHIAAIAKVKADGAEIVNGVRKVMSPYLIAAIVIGVVVLIIVQLNA